MAKCIFPGEPKPVLVGNAAQTCCLPCKNADDFCITIPSGSVLARSEAVANAVAHSLACNKAASKVFCLGDLPANFCLSIPAGAQLRVTKGIAPLMWTVLGIVPTGLNAVVTGDGRTLSITGTPTTVGTFVFSVTVVDQEGSRASRIYSIEIFGFTDNAILPGFSINSSYTFTFTIAGGTAPYVFTITSGTLPPGLTLSPDGHIGGTPTVDSAEFPFVLSVRDANGLICVKNFKFGTNCDPQITPALERSFPISCSIAVYSIKTASVFAISGTTILEINPSTGAILNTFGIGASSITGLFYENVHEKLYVAYAVGPSNKFSVVDPSTHSVVITATLSGGISIRDITYDTLLDRIWGSDGQNVIYVFNPATLIFSVIDFFSAGSNFRPIEGIAYCSAQHLIASAGTDSVGVSQRLAIINPAALTYSLTTLNPSDQGSEMAYCTDNGLLYFCYAGTLMVINPSTAAIVTSITLSDQAWGVSWNTCTHRIQAVTSPFGPSPLITAWWIDPSIQSVKASILTSEVLTQFSPTVLWFDSVHSRMLLATGGHLLKFT